MPPLLSLPREWGGFYRDIWAISSLYNYVDRKSGNCHMVPRLDLEVPADVRLWWVLRAVFLSQERAKELEELHPASGLLEIISELHDEVVEPDDFTTAVLAWDRKVTTHSARDTHVSQSSCAAACRI